MFEVWKLEELDSGTWVSSSVSIYSLPLVATTFVRISFLSGLCAISSAVSCPLAIVACHRSSLLLRLSAVSGAMSFSLTVETGHWRSIRILSWFWAISFGMAFLVAVEAFNWLVWTFSLIVTFLFADSARWINMIIFTGVSIMTFLLAIGAPHWLRACPFTMANFPTVVASHWFLRFRTVSVFVSVLFAVGARFWGFRTISCMMAFLPAIVALGFFFASVCLVT